MPRNANVPTLMPYRNIEMWVREIMRSAAISWNSLGEETAVARENMQTITGKERKMYLFECEA